MPIPPPDLPYSDLQFVSVENAFIIIFGFLDSEPEVEVVARTEDKFYRFYLPKHAKVVRDYWKHIGIRGNPKEGMYQHEHGGVGPISMTATLIGEDFPAPLEETPELEDSLPETVMSIGTLVLMNVRFSDDASMMTYPVIFDEET